MLVAWGDSDPFTPLDGPVGQFFVKQAVDRPDTEVRPPTQMHFLGIMHSCK